MGLRRDRVWRLVARRSRPSGAHEQRLVQRAADERQADCQQQADEDRHGPIPVAVRPGDGRLR